MGPDCVRAPEIAAVERKLEPAACKARKVQVAVLRVRSIQDHGIRRLLRVQGAGVEPVLADFLGGVKRIMNEDLRSELLQLGFQEKRRRKQVFLDEGPEREPENQDALSRERAKSPRDPSHRT